jgi:hypothetical protein
VIPERQPSGRAGVTRQAASKAGTTSTRRSLKSGHCGVFRSEHPLSFADVSGITCRTSQCSRGVRHSADMERVLRRAAEHGFVRKRSVLTTDDLLLALVMENGPAKDTLVSLGLEPSALRSQLMQSGPPPNPPEDRE